jgi:hypothetical protein
MVVGRRLRSEMKGFKGCPLAAKLGKQVVQLLRFIKKTRVVSDLPERRAVEQWWNSKNFQPWE